jgi:N-methylhydantoinase A/oxoprolinase/acetone carboxylase beta subunit
MSVRLGIDVGGTHTDAAILDYDGEIIGIAKASTTVDVITGIKEAIARAISTAGIGKATNFNP